MMKWKLTHTEDGMNIENAGGKNLGYDPNSGIQIIEQDGFAFKDLNNSGRLEPFEDWRLPLSLRVRDFSTRFGLWQEEGRLYYYKGAIDMPQEVVSMMEHFHEQDMKKYLDQDWDDVEYLKENDIAMVLLLMFDSCDANMRDDYLLQVVMQSMHLGVFENIVYSIWKAIRVFVNKEQEKQQLTPQGK